MSKVEILTPAEVAAIEDTPDGVLTSEQLERIRACDNSDEVWTLIPAIQMSHNRLCDTIEALREKSEAKDREIEVVRDNCEFLEKLRAAQGRMIRSLLDQRTAQQATIAALKRVPLLMKATYITEHRACEMIEAVASGRPEEAGRFGFLVKDLTDLVRQIDERYGEEPPKDS